MKSCNLILLEFAFIVVTINIVSTDPAPTFPNCRLLSCLQRPHQKFIPDKSSTFMYGFSDNEAEKEFRLQGLNQHSSFSSSNLKNALILIRDKSHGFSYLWPYLSNFLLYSKGQRNVFVLSHGEDAEKQFLQKEFGAMYASSHTICFLRYKMARFRKSRILISDSGNCYLGKRIHHSALVFEKDKMSDTQDTIGIRGKSIRVDLNEAEMAQK